MPHLRLVALAFAGAVSVAITLSDVGIIERLDESVQRRFAEPLPGTLGMSRIIIPSSFGRHFQPDLTLKRDFLPENVIEQNVVEELERRRLQVGFYLFGAAITQSTAGILNFRALKGPGIITRETPRPAAYPGVIAIIPAPLPAASAPDSLPDWNAIYPLARKAMRSFQDGGKGFDTVFDSWTVAARPVLASQESCVSCHNNPAYGRSVQPVKLNQAIGGVLYAFRRAAL